MTYIWVVNSGHLEEAAIRFGFHPRFGWIDWLGRLVEVLFSHKNQIGIFKFIVDDSIAVVLASLEDRCFGRVFHMEQSAGEGSMGKEVEASKHNKTKTCPSVPLF